MKDKIKNDLNSKFRFTIKTIDGKRLLIDKDGDIINEIITTIEEQDVEMSKHGLSKITVTLIAKCE